jgi:hypothetical protein
MLSVKLRAVSIACVVVAAGMTVMAADVYSRADSASLKQKIDRIVAGEALAPRRPAPRAPRSRSARSIPTCATTCDRRCRSASTSR